MNPEDTPVARRDFLHRATALAVGVAASPGALSAAVVDTSAQDHDRWLTDLRAPNRTLFDIPTTSTGVGPVHILNYYNTYNSAYGVPDSDINAIGTFYGQTTLLAVNDAMWAKHRLGELLDLKNTAGQAFTTNPWRTSVRAHGSDIAAASIEALQKRGVVFLVCNNALNNWVRQVANARGGEVAAVDREIRANLLPGVVVVPAMVIAIERAQKAGFAYNRQT